jgi:hypothetical protein
MDLREALAAFDDSFRAGDVETLAGRVARMGFEPMTFSLKKGMRSGEAAQRTR